MKKIIFLGCENSHSATFLNFIQQHDKYKDVQVLGVYSHDEQASANLAQKYNVPVMQNYDEHVGNVDGVVITARHGDNHLKYALPYAQKGVTMFLDKPITVSEQDAISLMSLCKENGVKICGGSCLRFDQWVQTLASEHANQSDGATLGGFVRCPMSYSNPNGGFFFYAQHLVEATQVIFGRYPNAVTAFKQEKTVTAVFHYENFDVTGVFVDECYNGYFAGRITKNTVKADNFIIVGNSPCFLAEWDEFYDIMNNEKQQQLSYKDFVAPVFVMNSIARSLESGRTEAICDYEVK